MTTFKVCRKCDVRADQSGYCSHCGEQNWKEVTVVAKSFSQISKDIAKEGWGTTYYKLKEIVDQKELTNYCTLFRIAESLEASRLEQSLILRELKNLNKNLRSLLSPKARFKAKRAPEAS